MSKIVLLVSHDKKTVSQVSRWIKEIPDDVVLQTADSLDELDEKYLKPFQNQEGESQEEGVVDDTLRVLIFDVSTFGTNDPIAYISQRKEEFQKSKLVSEEHRLKVMILSFDQSALPLRTFIHPDIDDLVMKPLDHELFLQKVGMMLADKSATEGSFLFKQKAQFVVEMAKEVQVTKLSEFGLVISNPTPLAPGVFAHLYSPIFGSKGSGAAWGRVFNTRRDPKNPGSYLCFFTFFGIQPEQLLHYRRVLRDRRRELKLHSIDFDPSKVPTLIRHVAIIDRNPSNASLVAESLTTNYVNIRTYTYSSYAQFLKAVTGSATQTPQQLEAEGAGVKSDPFIGNNLTFIVSAESLELLRVEPMVKPEHHFCGIPIEGLLDSTKWTQMLLSNDKDEFEEFILTLQRGHKVQSILFFKGDTDESHALLIRGENIRGGEKTLRLDLRALSQEEIETEMKRRKSEQAVFPQIDAVYIDALSIREFAPWHEGLRELLRKSNLLIGEKFSVCLMVDEKSDLDPAHFRDPNVGDFMYKPVDRRLLTTKAAVLVKDLIPSNDNVDLTFTPLEMTVRIAREVELSEVAEFGFQVSSKIPFREGVYLRFYSPIFLNENGEGILGRCTSCEPHPEDKETFGCFFTFFGVSDTQLKHIRNWIREDYVHKKDEAAG